ncbi:hypothetical protein LWI29_036238 [Acer saccharum]|uniref:Retrotransposon gag domain-containing protein n=1 Tax=Acer saccharum TaxID=4024 RepID=A0AA39VPI1_ACESA|nr:hypothetical protein LWI29_036238 [Acer saccharum]
MASDSEVAARVEEQARGRGEQRTHTKRSKSKGPSKDALEERIAGLEDTLSGVQASLCDAVYRLDDLEADYGEITQATKATIREFQKGVKEDACFLTQELRNLCTFVEHELRAIRAEVDEIRTEWASHRNSPSTSLGATTSTNTIQVPKPSTYSGNRKAMEVENFLFGLEQYFEAKGVRDNATRIANAPAFLLESAQLWWRRKHGDPINPIRTWDDFKRELKKQFSPTNAEKEARGRLRRLKQSGSISDYVKEFTTLTLEIEDMSDKDQLFFFMDGLKDWARVELERRNVQDIGTAIAAAESLADYSRPKDRSDNHEEERDKPKDHNRKEKGRSKSDNGDNRQDQSSGGKPEKIKPKSPCFICNGPHWVRDCPQRKMLSAMVTQLEESKATEGQASMGSIQQIYAIKGQAKPPTLAKKGLMFVKATIRGKQVRAMLDTGATHNFISVDEAKRLGLRITNDEGAIKAANSPVKLIDGTAKGVTVHLGPWSGKLDFSVVPLDDYQMVLGMAFFQQANAFPQPAANTLSILDGDKAYTVPAERLTTSEFKTLSAIQLVEKPSSPTSPRSINTAKGVPRKRSHARHGKQRSKATEGGATNAKLPFQQRRPTCTKPKESTPRSTRPTPEMKATPHERLPNPKSTRPKGPIRGKLQQTWHPSDEDVAKSGGGGCHVPLSPRSGFQAKGSTCPQPSLAPGRL